jgi:hypothetical protein
MNQPPRSRPDRLRINDPFAPPNRLRINCHVCAHQSLARRPGWFRTGGFEPSLGRLRSKDYDKAISRNSLTVIWLR